MNSVLLGARKMEREVIGLAKRFVECESPSDDADALCRMNSVLREHAGEVGQVEELQPIGGGAPHLRCELTLPGEDGPLPDGRGSAPGPPIPSEGGQILVLGHSDTVWPLGTLDSMPWVEKDGRLYGPGVFDMKGGLALFFIAARLLREQKITVRKKVVLLIVTDEEVGSRSSQGHTEREAKKSDAVLVLEPAAGPEGKLKTGRKGVGGYRVRVTGRASHAGLDFEQGRNAILALAGVVQQAAALTDLQKGTTVSCGVIRGGARSNVVPAEAEAEIDLRVAGPGEAERVDKAMRAIQPSGGCRMEISGGLSRPPMLRERNLGLFGVAKRIAEEMGVNLEETVVGGGSDGNFTSALGIPTLDGLGAVGHGAHSVDEHMAVEPIPFRVALLASLLREL